MASKIEEKLADKAEPILGFRPSSKVKRGRIGIIISIICVVLVIIELIRSGVIWVRLIKYYGTFFSCAYRNLTNWVCVPVRSLDPPFELEGAPRCIVG